MLVPVQGHLSGRAPPPRLLQTLVSGSGDPGHPALLLPRELCPRGHGREARCMEAGRRPLGPAVGVWPCPPRAETHEPVPSCSCSPPSSCDDPCGVMVSPCTKPWGLCLSPSMHLGEQGCLCPYQWHCSAFASSAPKSRGPCCWETPGVQVPGVPELSPSHPGHVWGSSAGFPAGHGAVVLDVV